MKNADECKFFVNELKDINIRQREIIRKFALCVAEDGGDEKLLSALQNYLEKIDSQEDSLKLVDISVEQLFVNDILNKINTSQKE